MEKAKVSNKQLVAFKIGARARKFAAEGCPIEGFELLYGAIAEAKDSDVEMAALLQKEVDRYERWVNEMDAGEAETEDAP
jgi:hypothetical protein